VASGEDIEMLIGKRERLSPHGRQAHKLSLINERVSPCQAESSHSCCEVLFLLPLPDRFVTSRAFFLELPHSEANSIKNDFRD
jgi:hypothetical protein